MFVVQESDSKDGPWHPCTISVNGNPDWARCKFENKREAEVYAYIWCNQATRESATKSAPIMDIGVPKMYQTHLTFGEPIYMRIIEK